MGAYLKIASRHSLANRLAVILTGFLFIQCGLGKRNPDLNFLYTRAAQFHDDKRNPIIVIPGVLGSRLVDADTGKVVWGSFGGDSINPETNEGASLFALPLPSGQSWQFSELNDRVVPDGVLSTMKVKLFGLPFQMRAYLNILQTLGAGGYRDESLGINGVIDYGDDHFTCFQFDYDWRRDLVENAQRLDAFIKEKKRYVNSEYEKRYGPQSEPIKFDLIAHSMGGLLARYYLRYGNADLVEDVAPQVTWAGAQFVDNAILIGTPNAGSIKSLISLLEGESFSSVLPKYDAALIGTFPSAYQLLPRTRHGALLDADNLSHKLDVMDPDLWMKLEWGLANPESHTALLQIAETGTTLEHVRGMAISYLHSALRRASAFHRALDLPAATPASLSIYVVAGDAIKTEAAVAVDLTTGRFRVQTTQPGDGTVLRSSVLMDERVGQVWAPRLISPIQIRNALFLRSDHLGMTKDPSFTDNILFYLLEAPP